MKSKELVERIKRFFRENSFESQESREKTCEFLRALGFELWANTWRKEGGKKDQ